MTTESQLNRKLVPYYLLVEQCVVSFYVLTVLLVLSFPLEPVLTRFIPSIGLFSFPAILGFAVLVTAVNAYRHCKRNRKYGAQILQPLTFSILIAVFWGTVVCGLYLLFLAKNGVPLDALPFLFRRDLGL